MRKLVTFEATSAGDGFFLGLPSPDPLPTAIEGGLFGIEVSGPIVPDHEDIAELSAEHAMHMAVLLMDIVHLERCHTVSVFPETGRQPRTEKQRQKLAERVTKELAYTRDSYEQCVDLYEQAFGVEPAQQLDRWVRKSVQSEDPMDAPKRQIQLFD